MQKHDHRLRQGRPEEYQRTAQPIRATGVVSPFRSNARLSRISDSPTHDQLEYAGQSGYLFPSNRPIGHQTTFHAAWTKTLLRAGVPYFRIDDLGSTYTTRLSAGGVADEWVTQLLRQGDAKVFKKYSQMKREALEKMNRSADESRGLGQAG